MKNAKFLFLFLLLSFHIQSCLGQGKQTESQKLVTLAGDLYYRNLISDDSLEESVRLLRKAILMDSCNLGAYSLCADLEMVLGLYDSALNRLIYINAHKPNPLTSIALGDLFWKFGKKNEAIKSYETCIYLCEDIDKYSTNVEVQLARLMAGRNIWGKEKTALAYDSLVIKFPDNLVLKGLKDVFYNYNTDNYIKHHYYMYNRKRQFK